MPEKSSPYREIAVDLAAAARSRRIFRPRTYRDMTILKGAQMILRSCSRQEEDPVLALTRSAVVLRLNQHCPRSFIDISLIYTNATYAESYQLLRQ